MSGNASRGIWRRAQIPVSTSRTVPMKTRKRFCEHGDLPCSAAIKLSRTFIETVALVAESDGCTHRCHAHRGHRRHEKRHAEFCPRNGCSICVCEFYAEDVASFPRCGR